MLPAEYLGKKGITFKRRGENLVFNCPFCGDTEEKAAMHAETGAFNCLHQNRCGEKGSFTYFQKRMGDDPKPKSYDHFVNSPKPKTYTRPKLSASGLSATHSAWFRKRGIEMDVLSEFGVKSDRNAIVFPYRKDGEIVAAKYRTLDKKMWKTKDSEPVLYGRDGIDGQELIICEGEIDCLSYRQYGRKNVVSVPSGASDMTWIENEWEWLEQFTRILISMDMDEAGRRAVEVMAQRLGLWRCYRVDLPYKDINECLMNGVKAGVIDGALEQADEFSLEAIVRPSDYSDEVVSLMLDPNHGRGQSTGFPTLDRILKGWRWGELTVWSGRNSSGKTTLLNQLMLEAMKQHADRVMIASFEMKPSHLLRWMMQQGGLSHKSTREDIEAALDALGGGLYVFNRMGKIDPEFVIEVFEYAARKYGIKHFVLDSLMRVSLSGENKYEQQENFVNRLVEFAQTYDCHIHLVAHPRKGWSDDDHPGKVDVAGAGDITNLAHNVLIMWRPTAELRVKMKGEGQDYDAILYVRKNREFGEEGHVELDFNVNTKRFDEWYRRNEW